MATLRQYFETDFNNTVRMHVQVPVENDQVEAVVLFDFSGFMAYISCYIPGKNYNPEFMAKLIKALDYGNTQLILNGKITLPSVKQFPGKLNVENKKDFEILAQFHGDPSWVSTKDIQSTRRVFLYCEAKLSKEDIDDIKRKGAKQNHNIQIRSTDYMVIRSNQERPLAFICHDTRDKDAIARRIAINLQKMLCPVWYDEFSLDIGDNLRESIERGLKECKKCILILSPSFLSNNGWTKKEFDSIFTREILEEKKLVLPVWYQVEKEQVFEYSPTLLNTVGANWNSLGEEEVCRKLHKVIIG